MNLEEFIKQQGGYRSSMVSEDKTQTRKTRAPIAFGARCGGRARSSYSADGGSQSDVYENHSGPMNCWRSPSGLAEGASMCGAEVRLRLDIAKMYLVNGAGRAR
jgi:hypothetical protein